MKTNTQTNKENTWVKTLVLVQTSIDVEDVALPVRVQVNCGDNAIDVQVFKLTDTIEPTQEMSSNTQQY